jgi:hypothetical protein
VPPCHATFGAATSLHFITTLFSIPRVLHPRRSHRTTRHTPATHTHCMHPHVTQIACRPVPRLRPLCFPPGVDIIEAGFPIASPDDFEAVRSIAMEVGNAVHDDGYVPVICGLSRTREKVRLFSHLVWP